MNALNIALAQDAQDQPLPALDAYEQAIASSVADLDAYINLAVLYFKCFDFGYAAHHKLPDSVLRASLTRAREILDLAETRFGSEPEVEFWRRYIAMIYLGGPQFHEEARRLVESGKTRVPYFYLISGPDGKNYAEEARKLVDAVEDGRTAKERYIRGVLKSHSYRMSWLRRK